MVLDKVHGLHATAISLNDRFTILAKTEHGVMRPQRRRNSLGSLFAQNLNFGSQLLAEQVARRLEMQAKAKRALKQRLGFPQQGLRRFGSESSLPRLWRSNSFGNLSQRSVKDRVSWRQSNGNLNRSASFSNLSHGAWRGFRRRGGGQRQMRGRYWGVGTGRVMSRAQQQRNRAILRRNRGGPRGNLRARGGVQRNQQKQTTVTKEELDRQLDQYMAGTKAALDLELDNYMKNAMEME